MHRQLPAQATENGGPAEPARSLGGRIPCLDGFRGLSILMVCFAHFSVAFNSPLPSGWQVAKRLGDPGVDFFFVISGFLITHLLLRERERTGGISLAGFYMRRALRILPAYAAFLAVTFLLTRTGLLPLSGRDWLLALTYTVNWVPDPSPWIGHVWSLSVEEHFYLMWPLVLFGLGERKGLLVLAGWVCASPLLRYLAAKILPLGVVDLDVFTLTRMDTIAVGCFLAYFFRDPRSAALSRRLSRFTTPVAVGGVALLFVSVFLVPSAAYALLVKRFVEAATMAMIVFACVSNPESRISRFLNWKPLATVGVLSYSMYLWQPFLTPPKEWTLPWYANWAAMLIPAIASHLLIERPFLQFKDRTRKDTHHAPPPAAPIPTGGGQWVHAPAAAAAAAAASAATPPLPRDEGGFTPARAASRHGAAAAAAAAAGEG